MENEVICKTGLEKGIIKKDVFDREVSLCKEMFKKDRGCCWGKCKDCGVLLLLTKLHKGELIDDKREIDELKSKFLN